ncbi:hypothetical protein ACSBR2_001707 [Camellia fascicularis]
MDLEFKGAPFTWSNNQRGGDHVRERLDRAVATVEWRTLFPKAQVFHELLFGSDHCPVVLNCYVPLKKIPRYFKFESMWSTSPSCVDVIRATWGIRPVGSPIFQLVKKLQSCRDGLRAWSKEHFGHTQIQISKLKSELASLQAKPSSADNLTHQSAVQRELEIMLAWEEMFLHQRSRVRWLNYGDQNSKFFHASMIQHRQRNQIIQLQSDTVDREILEMCYLGLNR